MPLPTYAHSDLVGCLCQHHPISTDQGTIPLGGILAEFVTSQNWWNISSSSSMETKVWSKGGHAQSHSAIWSRVFDEISLRENFAKLATKRFSCFAKMGDEFRSFAKLPILWKKRVSRNRKIAKTKKTWSKKSSVEIANWFCEESTKSEPNQHVNARYRLDTKWPFKFFAKYDYRFLLDVIIHLSDNRYFTIITTYFASAIVAIISFAK